MVPPSKDHWIAVGKIETGNHGFTCFCHSINQAIGLSVPKTNPMTGDKAH